MINYFIQIIILERWFLVLKDYRDMPDLAEQLRQKFDITKEEFSKSVLALIADEDFNLY